MRDDNFDSDSHDAGRKGGPAPPPLTFQAKPNTFQLIQQIMLWDRPADWDRLRALVGTEAERLVDEARRKAREAREAEAQRTAEAAERRKQEAEARAAEAAKPAVTVKPPEPPPCVIAEEITTNRVDTDEEPDDYIQDSEFPDYATNWDGTVICLGGPRKKKKRMRPYPDWAKTKAGKWYPTAYFTLTHKGKSERRTQAQMLMNRRDTLRARKGKSSLPTVGRLKV